MMTDEDWVKAAMADDSIVVDLLIRLNHHASPPHPPPSMPFDWSVRQPRSKPMQKPTARASPTTPLSWSGGTSISGAAATADGFEESSRPLHRRPSSEGSRSKLNASSETKKSRKKKTLTELKEEENLLVKERIHLKRELANLRVTFDNHRATNESLKRFKLDLQLRPVTESVPTVASEQETLDQNPQNVAAAAGDPNSSFHPQSLASNDLDTSQKVSSSLGSSAAAAAAAVKQENKFIIPDLNMPFEDDINIIGSSDILCGIS